MKRDPARERDWLAAAERDCPSGFAAHAIRRLSSGERVYGSRWSEQGLGRLLDELGEEAADLGSWGVLCLQALDAEDHGQHDRVRALVLDAIAAGAIAHRAIQTARAEHVEPTA